MNVWFWISGYGPGREEGNFESNEGSCSGEKALWTTAQ